MSGVFRVGEPRAEYLTEPRLIVVDCSVVAAQVYQEPERDIAISGMRGAALFAPDLLPYEILSVAVKKRRRGEHDAVVALGLELFSLFDLTFHRVPPAAVLPVARTYDLSGYDASYLWLAKQLNAPLFTFDRALQRAAQDYLDA